MSVDMSKVKVGTRIKYRSGNPAVITHAGVSGVNPFCTDNGIWHKPDGSCCLDTLTEYDIVEIIEDAVQPAQPPKPIRKRSAPLYGELLKERELLKIENHNLRSKMTELDLRAFGIMQNYELLTKMSIRALIAWWFRNRKGGRK